jgi:hypothetical protein
VTSRSRNFQYALPGFGFFSAERKYLVSAISIGEFLNSRHKIPHAHTQRSGNPPQ